MTVALFFLGAIFGSFLDVIAMRYHPDKFLFAKNALGGRSHCPHCKKTLRWFELVPLASFLLQRGRCRSCGAPIHPEHIAVEVISGLMFAAIPYTVMNSGIYLRGPEEATAVISAIWIMAFWFLLLMTLIDLKWQIIPEEINVALVILGALLVVTTTIAPIAPDVSFLGPYGLLFGLSAAPWMNALAGVLAGTTIFGTIILVTRGRGMGMGDMKLAAALGTLFRFPDIIVLSGFAFVIGSLFGIALMVTKGMKWKSEIPFGPFIALAAALLFFFGEPLARGYFSLIS